MNAVRLSLATIPLVALLAAPVAQAQTFRCQFPDGHVEYQSSTCPFGVQEKNVNQPNLAKKGPASAAAAAAPAPAPEPKAAAPITASHLDEPGADGQAPVTWGLVDIDYPGVSVRTLFDKLASLVGKKAVVEASVRERAVTARYHDIPWDEAVADIAERAGLAVRDEGATLVVTRKSGGAARAARPAASQVGNVLRTGANAASPPTP